MNRIVKYTELRVMNIKEARAAIVDNLINKWQSTEMVIRELNEELNKFEQDLNRAKMSGDLSENAAYDNALSNISTTQGRIFETQNMQRKMGLITESEFVCRTSGNEYEDIVETLKASKETSLISKLTFMHFDGDIEKIRTASRPKVRDLLKKIEYLIENSDGAYEYTLDEQEIHDILKKLLYAQKPRPYVPCGKIVLYSTVRAEVNGDEYVFMICPAGISYVSEGIVAADSELGKRLLNNSTLNVRQTIREGLSYTVKEIY